MTARDNDSVYRSGKRSVDARILRALADRPDGRTAMELCESLKADHGDTMAALERLSETGAVQRGRARLGSWVLTCQPPDEAA